MRSEPAGGRTATGDAPPAGRRREAERVFRSVAGRYDLMNDLMSGGVHRLWKAALLDRAAPRPGMRLLDAAGGTGDVAAGFLRRADAAPRRRRDEAATAIICDASEEMLAAGRRRAHARAFGARLQRICGNAERLPFPDRSVDVYTIAFGIRNVADRAAALAEALRVLRTGGRFLCLEFSHPVTEGLQRIYDAYSRSIIPWLGEVVARDREAYVYLVDSIRRFPTQRRFAAMIERAGFSRVRFENLTGGVAAIHSGWRL